MASSRNKIRSALLGRILFVALSVPRYPQPHPPLNGYLGCVFPFDTQAQIAYRASRWRRVFFAGNR
jgi:hypothetical protein